MGLLSGLELLLLRGVSILSGSLGPLGASDREEFWGRERGWVGVRKWEFRVRVWEEREMKRDELAVGGDGHSCEGSRG